MRNTEKVRRSAAPNLLVQFPLAELTLQLAVDPSKSRWSIPVRADGKSRRSIPARTDGKSRRSIPVRADGKSRRLIPTERSVRTFEFVMIAQGMWKTCIGARSCDDM
jgi:hypothetical protein